MATSKVSNDIPISVIVFRGKEYSVDALCSMSNQGVALKISTSLIDGIPDAASLSIILDSVIVVQSKNRYDHVFGKLQEDQQNKGNPKVMQTVRLFSTYSLKKALLSNVLAMQQPEVYVPPVRPTFDRKPYHEKSGQDYRNPRNIEDRFKNK